MITKNRISGDGYAIELWSDYLKYSEDSLVVRIDGEVLVGSSADYLVYTRCIHLWSDQRADVEVSEDEKKRILANVENAFAENGMRLRFK